MAKRREQIDSVIRVITPENIAFEYRLAGPFRRLPAFLIDIAIMIAIYIALVFVVSLTIGFVSGGLAIAIIMLSFFGIYWFYCGLFETYMNGQTPGKRLTCIRVLTTEGQPINAMQ